MLTLLFRFPGISTHSPHVWFFALVIFLALDKRLIVDPRETYVRCAEGHVLLRRPRRAGHLHIPFARLGGGCVGLLAEARQCD